MYTLDGTVPTCAGAGTTTTFTGASTTIPIPDPTVAATLTVHVIACGANQQPATEQFKTFNVHVAAPVITSAVGTMALGSPGTDSAATTTLTAQDVVTATITSPTAGSYICYSTDGATVPTCAAAGDAAACPTAGTTRINAVTGPVPVTATGNGIIAIGCKDGKVSTATGPVVYDLLATPAAVIGTATAACAAGVTAGVTVGFNMAAANTDIGGPTPAANICYSSVQIGAEAACGTTGGGFSGVGGGVTCFTPTTAAPTATVNVIETGNLYTMTCKANAAATFTPNFVTLPVTVTPFASPAITVDGTVSNAEWSTALGDQFPTLDAALNGGFTFGTAAAAGDTLFFSEKGFTAAATTDVVFYVTDNTTMTAGTITTARLLGNGALPFAAQYAIDVNTHGATGCAAGTCTVKVYKNAGGATAATWALAAPAVAVTAAVTANGVEASVLITALPGAEAIGDAFEIGGEVYDTVNGLSGEWKKAGAAPESYVYNYSSVLCETPLAALH